MMKKLVRITRRTENDGSETFLEKIMTEKFPQVINYINPQNKETQRRKISIKNFMLRYTTLKL